MNAKVEESAFDRAQRIFDEARTKHQREQFPYVWLKDAQIDPASTDLVKGLIPSKGFVLVYGPSGDGKTFWTIDLACHIASGMEWRSRRVRRSLVVYVAAEAGTSIVRRFVARREAFAPDAPLAIITRGANLLNPSEVEDLLIALKALSVEAGMEIGMVIFDTYSRSIPGGDENGGQDSTLAIAVADRLRDQLGATTLFVHHSGKDIERGSRGHNSLPAAADAIIEVVDKCATIKKSRDGSSGDAMPFNLHVIELGEDDEGDPMTTCVVEHVLDAQSPKKRKPLAGNSTTALEALREVIDQSGIQLPVSSTIFQSVRGGTLGAWRDQFRIRYGGDEPEACKKAFQRAKQDLLKQHFIQISDPYVWML